MRLRGMRLNTFLYPLLCITVVSLFMAGCNDQGQIILRGSKIVKKHDSVSKIENKDTVISEQKEEQAQNQSLSLRKEHTKTRHVKLEKPLNLKLPVTRHYPGNNDQLLADNQRIPGGNSFHGHQGKPSPMSLSGRVHWDESEAAETKPMINTIRGLELELSFKTR